MDSDVASTSSRASSPGLEEAGSPEPRPGGEPGPGEAQPESGQQQQQRLKVNSRERRRMQDLNRALDGLREVMPGAPGPAVRKLSKLATLLLARSHILTLRSSLQETRRLLSELPAGPRGPPLRLPPPAAGARSLPPSCPVAAAAGYLGFPPAPRETPPGPVYRPYSGLPCLCPLCQPVPATAASPSCLRVSK